MTEKLNPKCIVLSCFGGAQGELGVVRSLGRMGVHVVLLSEYSDPISRHSKYTQEFIQVRNLYKDKEKSLATLIEYSRKQSIKPVLFPTADPDLEFLSENESILSDYFYLFVSGREIIEHFVDKAKFSIWAKTYSFPVPWTGRPGNADEVINMSKSVSYPVILKPVSPTSWGREHIRDIVNSKKALKIDSANELVELYSKISAYDQDMVIQEYIPGRDDRLYSLHIYINKQGEPLGYFVGQKIRTYPTYAGIGCYVISVELPRLVELGIEILKKVQYTGLALLQFKLDPRNQEFKLLEINPRVSSWNMLATECGVNLPYIAYADTVGGLPVKPQISQLNGIKYIYFEHDLHAFFDYRKHGDCTFWQWLKSYRGRKVFQFYAIDDLRPYILETFSLLKRLFMKFFKKIG